MVVEKYAVTAVDTKEGWVTFTSPADPADTFRRTLEVHLLVHSRKPQVGDVFDFRTEEIDGKKRCYYPEDHLKKTSTS